MRFSRGITITDKKGLKILLKIWKKPNRKAKKFLDEAKKNYKKTFGCTNEK